MIKILIICSGFVGLVIVLISCTDPEPDEIEDLYPQEQIPWPTLADTPWPMVRHDPQATSRSNELGVESISGVSILTSDNYIESPVILAAENGLLRLGLFDGQSQLEYFNDINELQWEITLGPGYPAGNAPSLGIDRMFVPGDGKVWAIENETQELIWNCQGCSQISNITLGLYGELYFAASDPKRIVSLTNDGIERWTYEHPNQTATSFWALPIVISPDGNQIYSSVANALIALSGDGELLWEYGTGNDQVFNLLLDNDGNIYFYSETEHSYVCLTPDGQLRWRTGLEFIRSSGVRTSVGPTLDFEGNLYFYALDTSSVHGVVSLDNQGVYRWFAPCFNSSDLISDRNNNIYFGYVDYRTARLGAFSVDGNLVWEFEVSEILARIERAPTITSTGAIIYPLTHSTRGQQAIQLF